MIYTRHGLVNTAQLAWEEIAETSPRSLLIQEHLFVREREREREGGRERERERERERGGGERGREG